MFEAAYRKRLDADLKAWQADGIITAGTGDAIRTRLGPPPQGVNIPTVVGILGALLIAAAFLVFVAANWTEIARPLRFVVLLFGIAFSYALAAWFDRGGRVYLADICTTVGSIVFGAAIALTGQMYHLSGDFSAGILLWAGGALLAAGLTESRGALAVALVSACVWSGMRMFDDAQIPHFAFIPFWMVAAGLAVAWNAPSARHLVSIAIFAWWTMLAVSHVSTFHIEPTVIAAAGGALMLGLGLALASYGPPPLRNLGQTLSNYGALAFVVIGALVVVSGFDRSRLPSQNWVAGCAVAGLLLAFVASGIGRRLAPAVAGVAIALGLLTASGYTNTGGRGEHWLTYSLALIAMLSLIVSGMLEDIRPRMVAGWIGMAATIAAITWALEGSLLKRAVFLAVAGAVAVGVAIVLGKLKPKESTA